MTTMRNHNYRIGTDELADGRVKATARGRKHNVKTFPAGTTQEEAALALATKIEGERIARVQQVSTNGADKSDWAIYVNN